MYIVKRFKGNIRDLKCCNRRGFFENNMVEEWLEVLCWNAKDRFRVKDLRFVW